MTYIPNDPNLPLILPTDAFTGSIYDPMEWFCDFAAFLSENGYTDQTLPDWILHLHRLDYYASQVGNGGHSQLIHNSYSQLESVLTNAARGASLLGLKDHQDIIQRCEAFCRSHLDMSQTNTGLEVRHPTLDALDDEWFALRIQTEEIKEEFADLPENVLAGYRAKINQTGVDAFVTTMAPNLVGLTYSRDVSKTLTSLFETDLSIFLTRNNGNLSLAQSDAELTASLLAIRMRDAEQDLTHEFLVNGLREELTKPGTFEDSPYYVGTALFFARHPNLLVVPRSEMECARKELLEKSPFAQKEQSARLLEIATDALPTDEEFSISEAMSKLVSKPSTLPMVLYHARTLQLNKRSRDSEATLLKTTHGYLFACRRGDRCVLKRTRPNYRYRFYKALMQNPKVFKLVYNRGNPTLTKILNRCNRLPEVLPGRELAQAEIRWGVRDALKRLYIPEALLLWTEEGRGELSLFRKGTLIDLNLDAGQFSWQYVFEEDTVTLEASADSVRISSASGARQMTYPTSVLEAERRNSSRSTD